MPPGADIVAAYLYLETIYSQGASPLAGVKFRNTLIDPDNKFGTVDAGDVFGLKFTTQPLTENLANCWGSSNSQSPSITAFRVNVLHLLPKQYDANNRWTGKRLVNDTDLVNNHDKNGQLFAAHTVTLREGQSNHAVQSAGAALVVVYRTLDPTEKLRRIALYDGLHLQ